MAYSRLRRNSDQRKALLRDLSTDLILNGKISTTYAKAKELQKVADGLVKIAKTDDSGKTIERKDKDGKLVKVVSNDSVAYRRLASFVRYERANEVKKTEDDDKKKKSKKEVKKQKSLLAVDKLIKEIAPKYKDRSGGFTRVIKTDVRRGDAALMAIIEFV